MTITWDDVVIKIEELSKLDVYDLYIDENNKDEYHRRLTINKNSYPIEMNITMNWKNLITKTLAKIYVYKTHIFIDKGDDWLELPKEIDDILQFTLINGRPSKIIEMLFLVKGKS